MHSCHHSHMPTSHSASARLQARNNQNQVEPDGSSHAVPAPAMDTPEPVWSFSPYTPTIYPTWNLPETVLTNYTLPLRPSRDLSTSNPILNPNRNIVHDRASTPLNLQNWSSSSSDASADSLSVHPGSTSARSTPNNAAQSPPNTAYPSLNFSGIPVRDLIPPSYHHFLSRRSPCQTVPSMDIDDDQSSSDTPGPFERAVLERGMPASTLQELQNCRANYNARIEARRQLMQDDPQEARRAERRRRQDLVNRHANGLRMMDLIMDEYDAWVGNHMARLQIGEEEEEEEYEDEDRDSMYDQAMSYGDNTTGLPWFEDSVHEDTNNTAA